MTRGNNTDSEEESLGKPQPRDPPAVPFPRRRTIRSSPRPGSSKRF